MGAYYQAPEHEEEIVEPAPEYLERLARGGKDAKVVWRLRRQLPGRRSAGQSCAEHLPEILVDKLVLERCNSAPQLYQNSSRQIALELHMDTVTPAIADRIERSPSVFSFFMFFIFHFSTFIHLI